MGISELLLSQLSVFGLNPRDWILEFQSKEFKKREIQIFNVEIKNRSDEALVFRGLAYLRSANSAIWLKLAINDL